MEPKSENSKSTVNSAETLQNLTVCQVSQLAVQDILHLVRAAEDEGFGFVRRLHRDYVNGTNRFDRDGEALFLAKVFDDVVGVGGLNRAPYVRDRSVGRVRRVYVLPNFRRQGVAGLLLSAIVKEAKQHYTMLTLRTTNPWANEFYESLGFSPQPFHESATHHLRLSEGT